MAQSEPVSVGKGKTMRRAAKILVVTAGLALTFGGFVVIAMIDQRKRARSVVDPWRLIYALHDC